MQPLRRLGQMCIGTTFVQLGTANLRDPGGRTDLAAPVLAGLRKVVPLPADDATLVRLNGALHVGAGSLLMSGRVPRLAAAALAASLVPTTMAGHRYWEEKDPERRTAQKVNFLKNIGLLGGLLAVVA